MKFQEITDKQWNTIKKYLPKPARTGRPRNNDRDTINGILYILITRRRWGKMPKRYGSKSTAHRRLQIWQQKKIWKKILSGMTKAARPPHKLQLQKISPDSSGIYTKKKRRN